ncbi:MAG: tRNA uridine-5-carboxymethylaminomethyl(34) synthesis GTPase MnmE, partial [Candidatus Atribacteria bacterium]|nr:tRNA uridine-5-carboxymethylaminomethyl(34) synthesis GTPase MnmE [Candidatus Atribacteria bacterium]
MNDHRLEIDTIAAISTPMGIGGIGIVRISGPRSLNIASEIFRYKGKQRKKPNEFHSHRLYYGIIVQPKKEEIIDEVLLSVMLKPRSYTMEDTVEINCHGGLFVVKKILELVLQLGARMAEPGEFTKLAFLNGRIDLSQAEAVIDIIASNNEKSLISSLYQLSGGLKEKINSLKSRAITLNSKIEAPMDFPEQGIETIERRKIEKEVKGCLTEVEALLNTVQYGQIIKEGIYVMIVGKANVGKSSLFNALLRRNRSIVTSLPGTTRDIIEESLDIEGLRFTIVDTAGLKSPENIIEEISFQKVSQLMEYSQIFIVMFDASQPLDDQDMELIMKIKSFVDRNIKMVVVENKIDLPLKMEVPKLYSMLGIEDSIKVSVKNRIGIDRLEKRMVDLVLSDIPIPEDSLIITNKRH